MPCGRPLPAITSGVGWRDDTRLIRGDRVAAARGRDRQVAVASRRYAREFWLAGRRSGIDRIFGVGCSLVGLPCWRLFAAAPVELRRSYVSVGGLKRCRPSLDRAANAASREGAPRKLSGPHTSGPPSSAGGGRFLRFAASKTYVAGAPISLGVAMNLVSVASADAAARGGNRINRAPS